MQFKDYGLNTKEESSNSGSFLKFRDGESKRLILRGEIHDFYKKWVGGKGIECAPDEHGAARRFKVNAILEENGELVAKVWEFGITIYDQLRGINEEYPLETTKIKVTREGSTKDNTSYTVLPLVSKKDQLSQKQIEKIDSIHLHDFDRKASEKKPLRNYAPGSDDEEMGF